jgi:FixJ family two-component response regulator
VPIVVTTALGDEPTFEKALSLGATAFLRKPFSRKTFDEIFRKTLGIA